MELLLFFSKTLPISHNLILSLRPQPQKKGAKDIFHNFQALNFLPPELFSTFSNTHFFTSRNILYFFPTLIFLPPQTISTFSNTHFFASKPFDSFPNTNFFTSKYFAILQKDLTRAWR